MPGAVNRLTERGVVASASQLGEAFKEDFSKGIFDMNKILAALIAATFATGVFAQAAAPAAKKEEAAKPAAAASAAKKEEKKAEAKADKKEMKKEEAKK